MIGSQPTRLTVAHEAEKYACAVLFIFGPTLVLTRFGRPVCGAFGIASRRLFATPLMLRSHFLQEICKEGISRVFDESLNQIMDRSHA